MAEESLYEGQERAGGYERPLHETESELKMLEMPELLDICQGELHMESGMSPRERDVHCGQHSQKDRAI